MVIDLVVVIGNIRYCDEGNVCRGCIIFASIPEFLPSRLRAVNPTVRTRIEPVSERDIAIDPYRLDLPTKLFDDRDQNEVVDRIELRRRPECHGAFRYYETSATVPSIRTYIYLRQRTDYSLALIRQNVDFKWRGK